MNGKRHPVDRRLFLKSTTFSAAALATQTSGLGAPQAPAPPTRGPRKLVVVGAGIAGLSAALTAREAGASVVVLERAPKEERGGNTRFSNGAIRAVSEPGTRGLTREQYLADLEKVTQGRTDKALAQLVVDKSAETLKWLRGFGVIPYNSRAGTWNQGAAISDVLFAAAERHGVDIQYDSRAVSLIEGDDGIRGVRVTRGRGRVEIAGDAGWHHPASWRLFDQVPCHKHRARVGRACCNCPFPTVLLRPAGCRRRETAVQQRFEDRRRRGFRSEESFWQHWSLLPA